MALFPRLYNLISKLFRYDAVKRLKSALRPVKHFLFGKSGIYAAIDRAKFLSREKSENITTVLDVGAAVGDTALTFLKEFPSAAVYCFEPLPDSFSRLEKRVAGRDGRVRLFNFGLSDRNGKADFYVEKHRDSSSIVPPEPSGRRTVEKVEEVGVRKLDDVARELGLKQVGFLKIDVEGAEKEMLEGAKDTLKITDHVFVELSPLRKGRHNRDYIRVFEYLHDAGFSFEGVYGDFFFTKLL